MYKNTANAEALRLYRLGGRTFSCGVKATYDKAREYFQQAADLDKRFARAKGWLAYTLAEGWSYGWYPDSDRDLAYDLAQQALSLDGKDYQNHWTMAVVFKARGELAKAEAAFQQAMKLRKDDPDLLVEMAETLVYRGRHSEAIDLINQAKDRKSNVRAGDQTERVPHPDWYLWDLAWVLYFTKKDYQKSLDTLAEMTALPNNAYLLQAANYFRMGDLDSAKTAMDTHQTNEPGWTVSQEQAVEHFQAADMDHWLKALAEAGLPP